MTSYSFGKWLSRPSEGDKVVISGMAGHLPESDNIYEFQDNLFNKRDMVTDDDRRWNIKHFQIPARTAKIFNIDKFDPGFFGIHHRQADIMDPMMRKFMETVIEAVLDAGINPSELEGTRTGVFVGACYSDMEGEIVCSITEPQKFGVTGYFRCFIPNRISYYLKLKGPSVIVDTACSSSLNALELGFKAIRSGQCDNAIIGGVNLLLHPGITLQFSRLGVLSMDGVCKVFDQEADGYARSESIACIILQKANNAKRIYSEVLYTKVNSDGFKPQGITFPSSQMQKTLINEVLEDSGIAASDLSFLEAHGTGTEVGDPQEVEAIDTAIAKKRQEPLWIGSVKCNIGHSEPASGLCSLIKVLIAMETGLIAPNINIKCIKKGLEGFEQGRLKLVTELTELKGEDAVVGINNFGFGGNNCHMLLRRFNKKNDNGEILQDNIPRLICVSGRSEESVWELINDVNQKQLDREYVALLHQIFKKPVIGHLYRGYTIVSGGVVLDSSVTRIVSERPMYIFFGKMFKNFDIVAKQLLAFPAFRASMAKIDAYLKNSNVNVVDLILKRQILENDYLAVAVVQIGFVDVLKHLEIKPASAFGESTGRIITAYYNQVITLQETVSNILNYITSLTPSKNSNFEIMSINCDVLTGSRNYQNISNSKAVVLNLSDYSMFKNDLLLVEEETVDFQKTLGRLYLAGHNPQVHKLYPPVQFPVKRNTPMISPVMKWNHKKSWHTYKFTDFKSVEIQQKEFNLSYIHEECRYIAGHTIDGRNFVPATEYLNLVWCTYARSKRLLKIDTPIVFENCRFTKAVTMSKHGYVKLLVCIQEGSGNFEIVEKDSVVVSGRIYSPTNIDVHKSKQSAVALKQDDRRQYLEQDEIYRELYLRGYNYSGLFKGIVKCNVEATAGLIKWEDNWTTFMDKMLQIKILQYDTRSLYVPVEIKKITIDPVKHLEVCRKSSDLIPVTALGDGDIIKSGEIEIVGLQARAIAKKRPALEPVLEKYVFVPNYVHLSLEDAIRINTQIVLENSMESNFTAVEIVDEFTKIDSTFLLSIFDKVLEGMPLVNPNLIISSKGMYEDVPNIKIENFIFTPASNLLMVLGTKVLEKPNLNVVLSSISKKGFILTREELGPIAIDLNNFQIVLECVTKDEKLILLRKTESPTNVKCIEITSNSFQWVPQLQNALKSEKHVIVYNQNKELSGILGMVNCIRREPGGSKVKCFFMMDQAPKFDPTSPFYSNQIKKNLAINVYQNSQWGTYRHLLFEGPSDVEGEHFYVNNLIKGDLASLRWIRGPITSQTPLKKNQTLVYNYYSSLNFKDIMLASGRISADSITRDRIEQECLLGFEFSGKDASGRRIAGIANSAALSTYTVADSVLCLHVPDNWTLEEMATIPAVYSTVLYSLCHVVSIKPGMAVLIHSATGGIGIATINVCLHYGCTIFATVGTQEKRKYLREHFPQIREEHIGNSHDTTFETMIKMQTNGRGVDIVLNSLAEDKLIASVRCLAKGGHHLEIGKFDMANNNSLNLLLLEKQISYHGIMLDQIFAQSAAVKKWLVDTIYKGIEQGFVKPLPVTVFQTNEIEKAFRFMTTGKHMGKVLIKIRNEEEKKIAKPAEAQLTGVPRFNCDMEKSYIIIGGLGGFGLELADWLVIRGARNLVLVSTSGIKTGYQTQRIKVWNSYGVRVHVSTIDVTTRKGCIQLLKDSTKYGSIDAIFNLAVVLKDALFEDQTEEKFLISLSPKAHATRYLDEVTRTLCPSLRYFVVFSSVSCGRGNMGQTNYGMANSIMERICEKRKRDGFPALAIQWGAIGEVGLVAKMQKENKELVIGGTLQQKVFSCLEALDKFLNQDNPIVASMIVAEKHSKGAVSSAVEAIASILGIKNIKRLNPSTSLAELGMDSLTASEVIQMLEKDFDIYIASKEIRNLTLARLYELETEKSGLVEIKEKRKIEENATLLLQGIPVGEIVHLPVVKLFCNCNNKVTIPTVFMLCGIEGSFSALESVSKNLNATVLALPYNYENPKDTVEEMARCTISHIEERIDKNGHFFIIGYSYGTIVALEIVALLEEKGYSGTVVFIDGSPTYLATGAQVIFSHKTEVELETKLIMKLLSFLLPAEVVIKTKEDLQNCSTFDDRVNLALSMTSTHIANVNLEKQSAVVLFKRFRSLFNYKYAHEKVKSAVHLYRAKYPVVSNMSHDYSLSEYCEQVKVTELDGDHVTILNQTKLTDDLNNLFKINT